jgi:ribose transport system substrate-binding protein
VLAVVCTVATACGGASGTDSNATSQGSSSKSVEDAKAFVEAGLKAPTTIPVTEPLKKPPVKDKFIVCVEQNLEGTIAICDAAEQAVKAIGWRIKRIQSSSDPGAVQQAMAQALQLNPDAVLQTAVPVSAFPNEVKALAEKKIPYVTVSSPDKAGPEVLASVNGEEQFKARGEWLAKWVIAKSNGSGHAVVFDLSSYPIQVVIADAFQNTLKSQCPGCKVDQQDVQATEISTSFPGRVVNYLLSHPDVNYIFSGITDLMAGVPEALKAAGLQDKVHIVSNSGSLKTVQSGVIEVNVPDDAMIGWLMVDAVARHFDESALPDKEYSQVPQQYVTKDNVGSQDVPFVGVSDYQEQFRKVWNIG